MAAPGTGTAQETDSEREGLNSKEAVRDFIGIAVHDLREPLRAIRSSSDLLSRTYGDIADENAQLCVRYLQEGVTRMESLIRSISEYCYEELRDPDLQEVDLESALRDAESRLSAVIKSTQAQIRQDALPVLRADFTGLSNVFYCLLDNACKFAGNKPPEIEIRAQQQDNEWLFSVRDNGVGFKPVYSERIFEPFERLNGKQYPGSGLGLPLARTIVRQHGGRIWAESALGEGTTISFTLPVSGR